MCYWVFWILMVINGRINLDKKMLKGDGGLSLLLVDVNYYFILDC